MLLRTKILALLFLSIFAVPLLCTIVYLTAVKINSHQMQEKLEKSLLQKVSVKENELIWVEKGKEVLIGGKLFDVKNREIVNSQILLTGLFDATEDEIAKKISALQKNKNNSSPVCSMLIQLFCPAILHASDPFIIAEILYESNKFSAFFCDDCKKPFIDVTTPPPNVQHPYQLV